MKTLSRVKTHKLIDAQDAGKNHEGDKASILSPSTTRVLQTTNPRNERPLQSDLIHLKCYWQLKLQIN